MAQWCWIKYCILKSLRIYKQRKLVSHTSYSFSENRIYSVQFTSKMSKIVKTVLQHVRDEHIKAHTDCQWYHISLKTRVFSALVNNFVYIKAYTFKVRLVLLTQLLLHSQFNRILDYIWGTLPNRAIFISSLLIWSLDNWIMQTRTTDHRSQ